MRSRLARIIRNIRRKIEGQAALEEAFALPLGRAAQIRSQQPLQRGGKLYSFLARRWSASATAGSAISRCSPDGYCRAWSPSG